MSLMAEIFEDAVEVYAWLGEDMSDYLVSLTDGFRASHMNLDEGSGSLDAPTQLTALLHASYWQRL